MVCILDLYFYYNYSAGNASVNHYNRTDSQGWVEKLYILLVHA